MSISLLLKAGTSSSFSISFIICISIAGAATASFSILLALACMIKKQLCCFIQRQARIYNEDEEDQENIEFVNNPNPYQPVTRPIDQSHSRLSIKQNPHQVAAVLPPPPTELNQLVTSHHIETNPFISSSQPNPLVAPPQPIQSAEPPNPFFSSSASSSLPNSLVAPDQPNLLVAPPSFSNPLAAPPQQQKRAMMNLNINKVNNLNNKQQQLSTAAASSSKNKNRHHPQENIMQNRLRSFNH